MKEYSDVLSEDLATRLYSFGKDVAEGRYNFANSLKIWTNSAWGKEFIADSSMVLCIQMPNDLAQEYQNELEQKGLFDPTQHKQLVESGSAMIYVWSRNSYIPTHADAIYSKTITVYLNKRWSYNDGGLFHWQEKDSLEWKTISPTYNKAVVNDSGFLHGTTPVKSIDFRITVQTFVHPLD